MNNIFWLNDCHFYTVLAKSLVESQNKKMSMMFLSKEASNKDVNLKTQMMIGMKEEKGESSTERLWRENDFFKDQRTGLTIAKCNFLGNTHVYVNNGSITPVKGGHVMYLDFIILVQLLPVANSPPDLDLDTHKFQDNEILIYTQVTILRMACMEVSQKN